MFIHGAGASSAAWMGILSRVGRFRRSLAFDLPGHGQSTGAVSSVDEMRDAIGVSAAKLCLGPSVVVGHSLGGLVALSAALSWPDKVAGLVVVCAGARMKVAQPVFDVLEKSWPAWPRLLAETAYSPETPPDIRAQGASIAVAASQAQTTADFRAVAECDLRHRVGQVGAIRCPTLIVAGGDDFLAPVKWGALLAEAIPGAKIALLPRCGHMPMHEQPDALAKVLLEFLGGITART
ncbi:MAG: alpha/beta hydrolase [Deltaproteobacteria bacterium]|nr:alpha/beta hydrolase [Deltaproteobacteria bacterium]